MPKHTTRQMVILQRIDQFTKMNGGLAPTFRQLAEFAELRSVRTIAEYVYALRRKGSLAKPTHAREQGTLRITTEGMILLHAWDPPKMTAAIKLG